MSTIHDQAVTSLTSYGFDVIPLKPGTKYPLRTGWEKRDPISQWHNAPKDANVGIRADGTLLTAFIDCDHPKTIANAEGWLNVLGYKPGDYPVAQTTTEHHRHIYVSFAGGLYGDYRNLADEFGPGSFRYGPGSLVVAPPSVVNGNVYRYVSGDLSRLPRVAVGDVLPILENQEIDADDPISPIIPRSTLAMMRGDNLERYPSRSDAEQAIISGLVNSGVSFDEVFEQFLKYPCAGKFAELYKANPRNAVRWLHQSYDAAVAWTQKNQNPTQIIIDNLIHSSQGIAWPGRTGAVDRAVYDAHLTIARRAHKLIYAASARDLAELAGVATITAHCATRRLLKTDLLELNKTSTVNLATVYQINKMGTTRTLTHSLNEEVYEIAHSDSHDLWRNRVGLGKVGCQLYQALLSYGSMTTRELVTSTGRCRTTVERRLAGMACILDSVTGEIISLVERGSDKKWRAFADVDFDHLAEILGSAGTGRKQHKQHEAERRRHNRQLKEGKGEQ
jgi:hypothetical protein